MALPKLNTPTFELNLPSTGKKITYRPFLVREHKVLLMHTESDQNEIARVVTELVDACTFNKLKVDRLPYFDIEYIFMNLRAKSISERVGVVISCECGTKTDTEFSIDDLKVKKTPNHSNKIMLTDKLGIEMNYPKFNDVMDLFQTNDTEKILSLVIKSVKGIFNEDSYWDAADQTVEEVEEFIYSLTKQQFDLIENFFVTSPKIVQVVEADCKGCGKHHINNIEGLQNFFV